MFSKSNKSSSGRGNERRVNPPSIIASGCCITGDLVSDGEVQVDGRIEGDMRCAVLVVGESGVITGEISADVIRVFGSITGQIKAKEVEVAKTGRVVGDITQDSLSVQAGAYVQGRFERLTPEEKPPSEDKAILTDRNAAGQALLSKPQPLDKAAE